MKLPDLRHWQRKCDEVNKNAVRSMRERQCIVVDASSFVFPIPLQPREVHRCTHESSRKAKCYHRGDLKVNNGPDKLSKTLLWKYLEEEKQERELDEAERTEIRDFADPKILQ